MLKRDHLEERSRQLTQEVAKLRHEIEILKKANRDLYLALTTTAEHGDIIESQLQEANERLKVEVEERRRTAATLQALVEIISRRKADLEIVVKTIMEHGDVMDTQWAQKLSEMSEIATLDGLTQIPNRRRFDQHLQYQWKQMVREQASLSMILCDIDHFKQYNDAYGHLAGDQCLQTVAKALAQCVNRPSDLVARFGGEEFAAILPQTSLKGAVRVAQRMQAKLAVLQISHLSSLVSPYVTLSIGVASIVPTGTDEPKMLLDEADQHLYTAKQLGRNRIVSHTEEVLRSA